MVSQLELTQRRVKEAYRNARTILTIFFLTVGLLSFLVQIDWGNVPVLGLVFENIQLVILNTGRFLRLILASVIGLLIWQYMRTIVSGRSWIGKSINDAQRPLKLMEFGIVIMTLFILLVLWFGAPQLLPELFPTQTSLMSIIGGS